MSLALYIMSAAISMRRIVYINSYLQARKVQEEGLGTACEGAHACLRRASKTAAGGLGLNPLNPKPLSGQGVQGYEVWYKCEEQQG